MIRGEKCNLHTVVRIFLRGMEKNYVGVVKLLSVGAGAIYSAPTNYW